MNNFYAFVCLRKLTSLRVKKMDSSSSVKPCVTLWLLILLLLLASCADMFQPKIPFSDKNDPSSLGDFFRVVDTIEKLQPPDQFYIAPNFSSSEIRLTWTEVIGAAYYMVERAVALPVPGSNPPAWEVPDEGDYETLNRFVYGASFTDQVLKNPALDSPGYQNRYFYRVSSFNTAKKYEESDPSEPQSAMLFRAPGNLRASGGTSIEHVELRWEHSAGAESYEIWRSDFESGVSATLLGKVLGNQNWFQNKVSEVEQGKDFFYMVTAVNRYGNKSLQTRPAYGYARIFGAPNKPGNVRFDVGSGRGNSKNEIKIVWDADDDPNVFYAVFRYSSVDTSLTRLTEKTLNAFWDDKTGLRAGVYYYYCVQAILDDIVAGKTLRSEISSPHPQGFIVSPPDSVVAERSHDGTVTVKWLPAMGNENERMLYTYNVYSDSLVSGNFSQLVEGGVSPSTDAQGFISSVISNVTQGHTFFRVSTVNGGVESDKSTMVSPSPAMAVIQDASKHAFISANAPASTSGVYPVRITWKKPADDDPAFYHVQRSSRSGTGYSRVNDVALPAKGPWTDIYYYDAGTEIFTFIDRNENARVARKYFYRVLSLNQLEQGSFPSDERIGWGALTHTQWIAEFNKTYSSAIYKLTLMHRPSDTDKLGTETKYGTISGNIYYNAKISGLGGDITVTQTNYCDFYIENDPANGPYFILNGDSGSEANMSGNGKMKNQTITCTGMYPGQIFHGNVQLTGGRVSGGTYRVTPNGFSSMELTATIYGYAAGK